MEVIPKEYKNKLNIEMNDETGITRMLVQSLYVLWFFMTLFSTLWFLPLILSIAIFLTNLFYKNAYIAPMVLLVNLILSLMVYLFTVIIVTQKII